MSRKKTICLLCILCLICVLCNACGGGTAANDKAANGTSDTGNESKPDTGLFSGIGGWKTEQGNILLLESDGSGSILSEINYQGSNSNSNLPEVIKASVTWEENKDTVTVTTADVPYSLQKGKNGSSETLTLNQFVYTRLSEDEEKEYREKAAAAPESGIGQQVSQVSEEDSRNEDIVLEDPLELVNNENVTVRATRFFREVANEGTENEFVSAGFELEVENKTDKYDINVWPRDCSLSDHRVIEFSCWNSSNTVAPGKIAAMYFIRMNNEDFEDLNALYELEGNLDLRYSENNHSNRDLGGKTAFSIPDAVNGTATAKNASAGNEEQADETAEDGSDDKTSDQQGTLIVKDAVKTGTPQMTAEELEEKISEQPVRVVEAEVTGGSDERFGKNFNSDMIIPKIINESDSPVKDINVYFMGWDDNDLPVILKSGITKYKSGYVSNLILEGVNLPVGQISNQNDADVFELIPVDETCGIHKAKAIVAVYSTFDGEIWKNPYIQNWVDLYGGKPLE